MIYTHDYEANPICPYCNHEEKNAWEIDFHDDDTTTTSCGDCGKDYIVRKHVSVCYSSGQLEKAVPRNE